MNNTATPLIQPSDIGRLSDFLPKLEDGVLPFPKTASRGGISPPTAEPAVDIEVFAELIPEFIRDSYPHVDFGTKARTMSSFRSMLAFLHKAGTKVFDRDAYLYIAAEYPKQYSYQTAKRDSGYLRAFIRWLVATGRIPREIGLGISFGRGIHYNFRKPFTKEEYLRVRAACDKAWLEWLVVVGWNTGMSLIDCATLAWEHIDMDRFAISKEREKTRKSALVTFEPGSEFAEMLAARYKAASEGGKVPAGPVEPLAARLVTPASGPATHEQLRLSIGRAHTIHRYFNTIMEKAGMTGKSFHCFRRAWVSALVNSNISPALTAKTIGHASISMQDLYCEPDLDAIRVAISTARNRAEGNTAKSPTAQPATAGTGFKTTSIYRVTRDMPVLEGDIVARHVVPLEPPAETGHLTAMACDVEGNKVWPRKVIVHVSTLQYVDEVKPG